MTLLELVKRDESAASCLRSYASHYDKAHRDIGDDFRLGAEALEERATALRTRSTQEGDKG